VYTGTAEQIQQAQGTLTQLQERIAGEDAAGALNWFRVDQVLDSPTLSANTKYYALQILETVIKTRWRTLPDAQRGGIKDFVVNMVIQRSSSEELLRADKFFMNKLNVILVQVVKQEWPHNWPSFISDLVTAAKTSESLCENNLLILKLLSEEVFDHSRDEMTSQKAKKLKESFNADFSLIFQLCEFIMENSQKVPLLICTFQTLLKFLNWIPLGYIFETALVKNLVYKFLPHQAFRNDVLACLTEIGSLDIGTIYESLTGELGAAYDTHFEALFTEVATAICVGLGGTPPPMVQHDADMAAAHAAGSQADQTFIQNLALFFTCFFRQHLPIAEKTAQTNPALLQSAMHLLVSISRVDDQEVFKICLEYWNILTSDLYHTECQFQPPPQAALVLTPAALSTQASPRRQLYAPVLSKLRELLVCRMAKPEEVLIVEDENGEIVRETMKDSDAIMMYKTMRETLVYLTHLNYDDTENIMLEKLQYQVDGSQWSWHNLNTLCWAIGSISGAMSEEDEKRFLVTVIKDLLGLCEMKRGKDNKAVVASNIMYVVGQYPRFLRAHWKFLKTVVNKLFEFMHELHPGVQDMACDTFLKIAQKCRRKFVILQVGEAMPFIDELCLNVRQIISDLEPSQVQTFYEAVGYMVSAQADSAVRDGLLNKLMEWPNQNWHTILEAAKQSNGESLTDVATMKQLQTIIRTNERAATALGHPYITQLSNVYVDLLSVYKAYSEMINTQVAANPQNLFTSNVRAMRAVKKETLRLLDTFIEKSEDNDVVLTKLVPPLLDPVLGDYVRSTPDARDPEVLSLFTCLINKVQAAMTQEVPRVFDAVFKCTLEMITKNFEDNPEHRANLFNLLRAINHHCFPALLTDQGNFTLIIESIKWAFKHTERNVADTGLNTLLELLQNIQQSAFSNAFHQQYYLGLLQDVFAVLTDTLHKPGFKLQAIILSHLFLAVEDGASAHQITSPLWPQDGSFAGSSNGQYVRELLFKMFTSSFPNLPAQAVTLIIQRMFENCKDQSAFKIHLRDFLVQIKEFGDGADLYLDERQAELDSRAAELQKRQAAVGGLINPHARQDDGMAD
jgi:exportin-1